MNPEETEPDIYRFLRCVTCYHCAAETDSTAAKEIGFIKAGDAGFLDTAPMR